MAKRSINIEIDGPKLRELLARAGTLEQAADRLGCTRQTLYSWLSSNRIAPKQLSTIANTFDLSASQIQAIRPSRELAVLFRTLRDIRVPDDTTRFVKSLAAEIINLYKDEARFESDNSHAVYRGKSVSEMATFIRKVLELPHQGVTLDQLLTSLDSIRVPAIFFPFDPAITDAKIHAFTATSSETKVIFVGSDCALEDVAWRIFHELAHIFSGDKSEVSLEQERFCDAVASQILTPSEFFEKNRQNFRNLLSGNVGGKTTEIIRDIAAHLGASFLGVVLALKQNKIISRGSIVEKYLMKVHHTTKNARKTVESLHEKDDSKVVDYWRTAFDDISRVKLLKFHHLIKEGLLGGKISIERAAEAYSTDVSTMSELKMAWLSQVVPPDATTPPG
jgi:Zn-dependent peptidase ImmA (M78 family)